MISRLGIASDAPTVDFIFPLVLAFTFLFGLIDRRNLHYLGRTLGVGVYYRVRSIRHGFEGEEAVVYVVFHHDYFTSARRPFFIMPWRYQE